MFYSYSHHRARAWALIDRAAEAANSGGISTTRRAAILAARAMRRASRAWQREESALLDTLHNRQRDVFAANDRADDLARQLDELRETAAAVCAHEHTPHLATAVRFMRELLEAAGCDCSPETCAEPEETDDGDGFEERCYCCQGKGWDVFNAPGWPSPVGGTVQRCDDCCALASDDDAADLARKAGLLVAEDPGTGRLMVEGRAR